MERLRYACGASVNYGVLMITVSTELRKGDKGNLLDVRGRKL